MIQIQDILKIDLSKIENEKVKTLTEELIADYQEMNDKEAAAKIMQESVERVYKLISKSSPEALPTALENPCEDTEEKTNVKPKKKASKKPQGKPKKKPTASKSKKKEVSKTSSKKEVTKTELNELEEEVKVCRVKMKMYREEKRKLEGPKPTPSRYAKIKGHFISLGNLIPKSLKDNLEVQKEANKILRNTHRALLKTYRMTAIKGQKDNEELKERYEKIEEKLE